MSRKALVLVAHPDDAEIFVGGTLAQLVNDGLEVTTTIATDGDKGSFTLGMAPLAKLRRTEALNAAKVLGVKEVVFLGYHDGELDQLPPGHLRERFVRAIRERRPDIVITFDPFAPFEDHPDHRAVAYAALEAVNFSSLPLYYPEHREEGLLPHIVAEKYFFAKDSTHANKVIDISNTLQTKIEACLEHKSQVTFMVEEVLKQASAASVDIKSLLPGLTLTEETYALAIAWMVQEQARVDGMAAGLPFAERFRYTRFSPIIDALLQSQNNTL